MYLRNLTPHEVLIEGQFRMAIKPSGVVPRVEMTVSPAGAVGVPGYGDDVPLVRTQPGPVMDLPAEEPAVLLIVSRMVAAACPERHDLVVPDDLVRDESGRIVACRRLAFLY